MPVTRQSKLQDFWDVKILLLSRGRTYSVRVATIHDRRRRYRLYRTAPEKVLEPENWKGNWEAEDNNPLLGSRQISECAQIPIHIQEKKTHDILS